MLQCVPAPIRSMEESLNLSEPFPERYVDFNIFVP